MFKIKNNGSGNDIYSEQEQTANLIHQEFLDGKNQVELRADCQQGKTGTVFCVMNQCGASARAKGAELFVLYLVAQSANMLKLQTQERIVDKLIGQHGSNFISNKIVVFHHGDALSYNNKRTGYVFSAAKPIEFERSAEVYRPERDYLLVVLDESHIGTSESSVVDDFLKSLGIERGCSPSEWANKRAWLLFVSATDFGNEAGRKAGSGSNLSVVDMVRSPKYYGTDNLLARSLPRTPKDGYFDKNGNLSLWMTETVLPEMLKYINGPFTARNSGENQLVPTARLRVGNVKEGTRLRDALEAWAFSNGFNPKGIVFHSGGKGDEPIENFKLKKFERPRKEVGGYDILFLFIIDAVAAGSTIDLESTCLAVEALPPKSGNAMDAKLVQEAGRYNGYHGWTDFPVFLHQPSLDKYIRYLKGEDVIPTGTNVSGYDSQALDRGNSCEYKFVFDGTIEYTQLYQENSNASQAKSKISKNDAQHDLANYILVEKAYSAGGGNKYRPLVVDGPSEKYPESWKKLLDNLSINHPELFGGDKKLKKGVIAFPTNINGASKLRHDQGKAVKALSKKHVVKRGLKFDSSTKISQKNF